MFSCSINSCSPTQRYGVCLMAKMKGFVVEKGCGGKSAGQRLAGGAKADHLLNKGRGRY